jgi:hypothetical protein
MGQRGRQEGGGSVDAGSAEAQGEEGSKSALGESRIERAGEPGAGGFEEEIGPALNYGAVCLPMGVSNTIPCFLVG